MQEMCVNQEVRKLAGKKENWFVVLNQCGHQLEFEIFNNKQVLSSPNIIPIVQVGNCQNRPKKFVVKFHENNMQPFLWH